MVGEFVDAARRDEAEGCGACLGIKIAYAAADGPCCHLCRKRDEQEDAPYKSGVEGILSEAAEGHLAYADGYEGADDYYP